jgi:hypothetical protein
MRKMSGTVPAALMLLALIALESRAAAVSQNIGVVTQMWAHATFGGGDVYFAGTTGAGSCQAFWLRASDSGFKNLYAVLITARATSRPVRVYAYDNELWGGSGTPTCRVEAIDLLD